VEARGGHAFDPAVAAALARGAGEILAVAPGASAWRDALAGEPEPQLLLRGESIDGALAAMGDFTDLLAPELTGHSSGVARLAGAAAARAGLAPEEVTAVRRAGLVHDLGRVAIEARTWRKPAPLTPDEWERVRLHAYETERVLSRSPFLAALAPTASSHHERLDGSGYHRGSTAAALPPAARLLAAADAFHAMTEPRAHRAALTLDGAASRVADEARAGRLDAAAAARDAPRRPDRARGRGRRPARARAADEGDRPGAGHLGQGRGPPHPGRLREDESHDPRRGDPLRDAARALGTGRIRHMSRLRRALASSDETGATTGPGGRTAATWGATRRPRAAWGRPRR
jgi:hypothetical protein